MHGLEHNYLNPTSQWFVIKSTFTQYHMIQQTMVSMVTLDYTLISSACSPFLYRIWKKILS